MLIKGVNKRIIEVLNPEDECFERIILFLNPNCAIDDQVLSRKTGDYVDTVAKQVKKKAVPKRKLFFAGELLSAAAVGGFVVAAVSRLM